MSCCGCTNNTLLIGGLEEFLAWEFSRAFCRFTLARTAACWNNRAWPNPMRIRVLGIVLAGGKGTRLYPLTKERAKPAVPFGGKYRIIDFVLSNFINSGIYSLYVLTQFRSQSLLQHLTEGWQFGSMLKIPVRHPRAGPDAFARRDLVPGDGRRDLPEHQPGGAIRPARGGDLRRRPHLPHEHHEHDRIPRAEGRRGHRRRHPGRPGSTPSSSA